jgi:hypothetical protein
MKSTISQIAQDIRRQAASLDSRYGEIGIPAVAAALQYKTDVKNPAAVPVVLPPEDRWFPDMAA